jgi:DNA polymerase-3 subunit gamma/tau
MISSLEKNITLADAERVTGRTGLKKVQELAALIVAKDAKGALAYLNELNEDGHNLVQFAKDLIHYLRKVLSLKVNPSLKAIMERDLTKDEVAAAIALGAAADTATLVKVIKALIRAYAEMRYSPFAIVPLEVALVEQLS